MGHEATMASRKRYGLVPEHLGQSDRTLAWHPFTGGCTDANVDLRSGLQQELVVESMIADSRSIVREEKFEVGHPRWPGHRELYVRLTIPDVEADGDRELAHGSEDAFATEALFDPELNAHRDLSLR